MVIKLSIKSGKVFVDPYYAPVKRGEPIEWTAKEGCAWTIGFKNKTSPTDELVIHGVGSVMDGKHVAKRKGHYPYTACVTGTAGKSHKKLHGKEMIFLDVNCPEIIIDI